MFVWEGLFCREYSKDFFGLHNPCLPPLHFLPSPVSLSLLWRALASLKIFLGVTDART
jgi:hypothetical protein